MNKNWIRTSLITLLLVGYSFGIAAQSVRPGMHFPSPDGRYSVALQEIDRQLHFVLKRVETGTDDNSIVMPTVLLYLHWAEDSRSLVTVEHIAHGSYGRVIYFKKGQWCNVDVQPPGEELRDSAVVSLEMRADRVHYKFAVRHIGSNGKLIEYRFCDLDVDLRMGQISNVVTTRIDQAEFIATLRRKPSYIPPMQNN